MQLGMDSSEDSNGVFWSDLSSWLACNPGKRYGEGDLGTNGVMP